MRLALTIDLETATAQDVFDLVFKGLAGQGFMRSFTGEACQYRGDEGRKCAAGFLLTDETVETNNVEGRAWARLVDIGAVPQNHLSLIRSLQDAHDTTNEGPEAMRAALEEIAESEGLTIPAV